MALPLEIAVFSSQDALTAQSLGASRIEFNAPGSYPDGGLTPPIDALTTLSPQLTIPMRVMVRPRGPPGDGGGPDFLYTPGEFDLMRQAILDIKVAGVMSPDRGDGFVFGILSQDSGSSSSNGRSNAAVHIDMARCNELIELAKPIPCVFHRAFDPIASSDAWKDGLDVLITSGFDGVLTAGGAKGGCGDNTFRLDELIRHAAGRIEIVAGGGVRHHNVQTAAKKLVGGAGESGGKVWLHSAALRKDGSGLDEGEVKALLEKLA
ncbi:hypothetical protein K4F52_003264 [Lecanicillium sp. MT-2017a]|nr:hypothetical protein K4F52_003264 [Lecanicillium sp. MT-2017a]